MQRVTTLNITRDIMILLIHLIRNHNVTLSPSVRRLEMSTYVYALMSMSLDWKKYQCTMYPRYKGENGKIENIIDSLMVT